MVAGPLRTMMAAAAAGAAAFGPMTGNAIAQEYQPVNAVAGDARQEAFFEVTDFGRADRNNIGVLIYYGQNEPGVTAERIGDTIVNRLEAAADRAGTQIDVEYRSIDVNDMQGAVVTYAIGGVSIDNVPAQIALARPQSEQDLTVSDQVVRKRIDVNRTLDFADLSR